MKERCQTGDLPPSLSLSLSLSLNDDSIEKKGKSSSRRRLTNEYHDSRKPKRVEAVGSTRRGEERRGEEKDTLRFGELEPMKSYFKPIPPHPFVEHLNFMVAFTPGPLSASLSSVN